ncbi:MAG TPA: hypothetical protein VJ798_10705 [Rhizomicrobium sp.]|nr:hypothetical protein [Rhizomicrobium sp.]
MPLTRADAWKIALALPGAEERPWFNRPCVFIHDRFLTRVHDKEDAVVLQVGSMEMREMMLEAEPELFYITDHYRNFPFVLARLKALTKTAFKGMLVGRAEQLAAMPPPKRPKKKAAAKKAVKKKAR